MEDIRREFGFTNFEIAKILSDLSYIDFYEVLMELYKMDCKKWICKEVDK